MVFNGGWVVAVAKASAELCQYIACNPELLRSEEVLDLIFCFPLHQLGRLALCICSFFCLPTTVTPFYVRYHRLRRTFPVPSSSSSSSSDDDSSDYSGNDSHSD